MPIESALTKIRLLGRLLKLKNRILLEQSLKQTLHNSLNLLSIKFSHFCLKLFDFPVGLYVGTPFTYSNIYLCDIKEDAPSYKRGPVLSICFQKIHWLLLSVVSHPLSKSKFFVIKTMTSSFRTAATQCNINYYLVCLITRYYCTTAPYPTLSVLPGPLLSGNWSSHAQIGSLIGVKPLQKRQWAMTQWKNYLITDIVGVPASVSANDGRY